MMNETTRDLAKDIVDGISSLIMRDLRALDNESRHPGFDADKMDSIIAESGARAKALRALRERFEDIMGGTAP